jgi:6-pyruvoyltetrahydropterin/6-carboxytetrahydropterin synthase
MLEVTSTIEWDMGHRVPNHRNKCQNPHGHRYRLEVTVRGPLVAEVGATDEGMVEDFGGIKLIMREHVHDVLDHTFMIFSGDRVLCDFFAAQGFRAVVVPFIPTAENVAVWCYERLKPFFLRGSCISRVRIFETPNCFADFTPSPAA